MLSLSNTYVGSGNAQASMTKVIPIDPVKARVTNL